MSTQHSTPDTEKQLTAEEFEGTIYEGKNEHERIRAWLRYEFGNAVGLADKTIRKLLDENACLQSALTQARAELARAREQGPFDMAAHLKRQAEWSKATFGPGSRAAGVIDHIRKELIEIEENPRDLEEWIDVTILALDGAWRSGASPQEIVAALVAKQSKNERREWPDWRTSDPDKAITHITPTEGHQS